MFFRNECAANFKYILFKTDLPFVLSMTNVIQMNPASTLLSEILDVLINARA